MRPSLYDLQPAQPDWYWQGVDAAAACLDDSEIETGEPPATLPHVFAEAMNVYAQSGNQGAAIRGHVAAKRPLPVGGLRKNTRLGLDADVMPMVEAAWEKLPNFDDLVRAHRRPAPQRKHTWTRGSK